MADHAGATALHSDQLLAEGSNSDARVISGKHRWDQARGMRQKIVIVASALLGIGLLTAGAGLLRAGFMEGAAVSTSRYGQAVVVRNVEVKPPTDDSKGDDNSKGKTGENETKWWLMNKRLGEAWPSIFGWSHIEEFGDERELLISQLKGQFGIFACNDFVVISRSKSPIELGPHPWNMSLVVRTWPNPLPPDVKGDTAAGDATASYKNARTFLVAWKTLMKSGVMWRHDWIVKSDPDAVFFPDRLRMHVEKRTKPPHGPGPFYVFNCNLEGGRIYGALEVYSLLAIKEMDKRGYECEPMPLDHWGEDLYMEKCMQQLNGPENAIRDYTLVGDGRCTAAPCTDTWRAAFHPMPTVGQYWDCARTATHR